MLEFWQRVAECNPNHQNKVLTALDPELSGEKALFSNGRLIWESRVKSLRSPDAVFAWWTESRFSVTF